MGLIRLFWEKKYLLRIFMWITCVILLIVLSFSALVYVNVERKVFKSEYENSQKVLSQIRYNIDFMDTTIRNLTLSTYSNNDVKALMYLNDEETYENLSILNKLNASVVSNNPFLNSIYIYNNHKNVYYTTFGDMYRKDESLERLLAAYSRIPALKAIVRDMEVGSTTDGKPKKETVISYIMYETVDERNRMDGAVILNIKLDWLADNVREMNRIDATTHSEVYIVDGDDKLIETDPARPLNGDPFAESIKEGYRKAAAKPSGGQAESTGYFLKNANGEKYVVSYAHLKNTGWTLLETKLYREAYASLKQLLDTILLITVAVFAGAVLLTLSVSRGIYQPVRRLMEQAGVGKEPGGTDRAKRRDEFSYLTEVYRTSREQLYEYNREKSNNTNIMRLYFLKKLLADSSGMSDGECDELLKSLNPSLSKSRPFFLCILRIDDYKAFMARSLAERELLRFAIANIATETLAKTHVVQTVDMKDDSFTVLLNAGEEGAAETIGQSLREAQAFVRQNYHISFSATVSDSIPSYSDIASAYGHTLANSMYRYVFGAMSVITTERIEAQTGRTDIEHVLESENKLIEAFRKGDAAKTEERFRDLFRSVRKLEYSDIMLVGMHLVHHLKKAIYEMNRSRAEPIRIPKVFLSRELHEEETIEAFERQLLDVILTIGIEGKAVALESNQVAADTIKEIIESNYFDSSLSAASISDMMRLPPYRLSKISKEHINMSIPEYINQIRLGKAIEWMENSKLSIQEIMRRVGVENESYFYKLFKSKFGMTPREYMSRRD